MIKIYTIAETAKILRVNKNYVYNLIKEKKLKSIFIGSMKITENELLRFINECENYEQ